MDIVALIGLAILVGLPVAAVVPDRGEPAWLLRWVLSAVILWVPVLVLGNATIPFSGGSDDGCCVRGSWLIGDTTRWKLPAVSLLFLIAAVGFARSPRPFQLLASWLAVGVTGWTTYYWILGNAGR